VATIKRMRILVPLDGSNCAEQARLHALRIAKAEGASIEFRTFVDPRAVIGRNLPDPLKERHVAAAMAEARAIIEQAIAEASNAGARAYGYAELGEPAPNIVKRAKELKADAIVMGTHGRSGFKRLSMGSVAEDVLRSALCPVIVVREQIAGERAAPSPTIVEDDQPIFALRFLEVAPDDFERLYGEIATFMDGPGAELTGVLETELLGSADRARIVMLVKFSSRHDWARAQWDRRLAELLEEITANSETLEFDLYFGDRFAPKKRQRRERAPLAV
jgi:universal stress protein A